MLEKILNFFNFKKRNNSSYDAGKASGRYKNWRPRNTYALYNIREDITTIISRSRDLVRNNPFAKNAMRIVCNNVIRDGIQAKFKSNNSRSKNFTQWSNEIDIKEIQHLIMKTIFQSGSVLIRKIKKRLISNSNIPLSIQILEPEWIDFNKHQIVEESGNRIISGKEYTKENQLVAYHLHKNHPQNILNYDYKTIRVSADEILHIYETDRPDEICGMPFLANCTLRLKQFDDCQDARLEQQKVAACFAIFTKGIEDLNLGIDNNSSDYDVNTITPGMIAHLGNNDVTVATPPNADDGDLFAKSIIREIAGSLGITYEQLTGDYSQVNFSSARMARIEFRANVKRWQDLIIKQFLTPLFNWYNDAATISGMQLNDDDIEWIGASVPAVDLEQQAKAYREMIRNGLMTQSQALSELGVEATEFYAEYANDNQTLDNLNIILDTDARKTARGGTLNEQQNNGTD